MEQELHETKDIVKQAKSQYSILGWGIFIIMVIATLIQFAGSAALSRIYSQETLPSWVLWTFSFLPLYLVAIPAGLWVFRKAPASPPQERALKPGKFVTAVFVSLFMMYAGSLVGGLFQALLQAVFGLASENPLISYVEDDLVLLRILFMVILAPLIEEFIFRRQFIDRTRLYGGKLAIVTSAVAFGFFHGNLFQFFYATALGLVFGYIYLHTGRLRYSIALHMMINLLGSVIAPAIQPVQEAGAAGASEADLWRMLPSILYMILMMVAVLAGLILLCLNLRKLSFPRTEWELPAGTRLKTVCFNSGMLLFVLVSLGTIMLTFLE